MRVKVASPALLLIAALVSLLTGYFGMSAASLDVKTPDYRTPRQILDTPTRGSVTRVQAKPILFRSMHAGKHPQARSYGVYVENEQRRGGLWWMADAYWKGKLNFTNTAEGIVGKYYGYAHANVVRRNPGSGGSQGSVGGWALSAGTNNEQNLGGFNSISNVAGDSATFTFTGDAAGMVGCYFRSDLGGYAMVGIDGDYTIPTGQVGPLVQTVTQGDINFGRFPSTFVDASGTTTATLGKRYVNFRRNTLFSEDVGLWEDTGYSNTEHTLQVVVLGANSAKDASGYRIGFSGFFASSATQGTVLSMVGTNGGSSVASFTTSSGAYVFEWRPIAGTRLTVAQNTKPITGGGTFVEDSVYEMSSTAGGTYYFNRVAHADGSSTGVLEMAHTPYYVAVCSGTNNASQAVLNVRGGDGLGLAANDWIWIESRTPELHQIQSIATDALTLTANLASAKNLNTASEKVIRCETVTSGAVTASASITLASDVHQLAVGDVVTAVKTGATPVTFTVSAISGTALTADRAVTIATASGIMRISQRGYEQYWMADNRIPIYLTPGGFWSCTDKLELRRVYTSSFAGEGTTASTAHARGDTTIEVVSDSTVTAGELLTLDAQGAQVRKVVSKAANVITIDQPLDSYMHTGARVARGMFRREDVCSWSSTDSWQLKVQWIESGYKGGDAFKNMYDVMATAGYAAPVIASPAVTATGATNTTPIVVTVVNHPFQTGDRVRGASFGGNTATNADWRVTYVDANSVSLNSSVGNGTYTSGGTLTEVPLTYISPFDSVSAIPLRAAPTVDAGYDAVKTYNGAGTSTTNVSDADMAVFYSTTHSLIYATRMDDVPQLNGTLLGTGQLTLQNRATADYKLYWQVGGSDGGTTERTIGYNTIRFGSYGRQIRRTPLIAAYAAR